MRIAFAGNPNSGKTTMFNALTGRNEKVGNWAGVTVEKKEGRIKRGFCPEGAELVAVDLPGAYSMSPFTAEESVTRDYIKNEKPDVIVNIVDATNLSRSLFFTTQLLELGVPMVVALNKSDINRKKQTHIDAALLARKLGCPVVETVSNASGHNGLEQVVAAAVARAGVEQEAPFVQTGVDLNSKKAVQAADRKRFEFVNAVVRQVERRRVSSRDVSGQDRLDDLLTNKWLGIPIFALVMFLVFDISQSTLGPWIADYLTGAIDRFRDWVAGLLTDASPLLQALVVDGMVGGVGAVVGFLPLVMVMYFLIAMLEDCGYMARVSVVLDPIFKRVGLSGKAVIPFVVGTGCAVPGIMACRTIRSQRERRAAAMLTPFMPCGAKLPVIALFAGAFFANASWVGTLMYFAGILIIVLGALLVNRITGVRGRKSYFIIELPEYKWPDLKRAALSMCARGWSYIVKAGTVILLCNTAVHIMQSFTWNFALVEEGAAHTSILASIARPAAYLLIPVIGVLSWQLTAAAITGFIAKENVVGTLAVCCMAAMQGSVEDAAAMTGLNGDGQTVAITTVAGLSYLMFNLFSPPCFAALGAMNAEMEDKKWFWSGVALQLAAGYTVAFLVYQLGTLITEGTVGAGFVPGLAAVLIFAAVLTVLALRGGRVRISEYARSKR